MNERAILTNAIDNVLGTAGFSRKGASWYLSSPDTVGIVDLQRSDYGKQYYLNIAIWLKNLGDTTTPKEHQCHIRCRATSLTGIDSSAIQQLFDVQDQSLTDAERTARIEEFICERVLPFIREATSLATLQVAFREGRLPKGCLIHRDARALLSREIEERRRDE